VVVQDDSCADFMPALADMPSQPNHHDAVVCVQLVEYAPEKRMTAAQALAHPLISASCVGKTLLRAKSLSSAATEAAVSLTEPWLSTAASGAERDELGQVAA
jgi:hypothetical protein